MEIVQKNKTSLKNTIWIVSFLIPVAVAFLLFAPLKLAEGATWVGYLPHINGLINSLTAVLLVAAVISVKKGNIDLHKQLMLSAFVFGALFLVSYVVYHASAPSTVFGDVNGDGVLDPSEQEAIGWLRAIYLFILLSHILLAIVVLPFVLFAFYYALSDQIAKHKNVVKYTFPIWLYVSITGVIVYLMISPYYQ